MLLLIAFLDGQLITRLILGCSLLNPELLLCFSHDITSPPTRAPSSKTALRFLGLYPSKLETLLVFTSIR